MFPEDTVVLNKASTHLLLQQFVVHEVIKVGWVRIIHPTLLLIGQYMIRFRHEE